jgi:hypothetical protein
MNSIGNNKLSRKHWESVKEPSVNGSCRGREGGLEALNAHPPKGVTPRLSAEQKAQIPALLVKGAEAYGCARGCVDRQPRGSGDRAD